MRAIALTAFALALMACSASSATAMVDRHIKPRHHQHAHHRRAAAPDATTPAPWKIVNDWSVSLGNGGLQIEPVYTSVAGMYVATTANGNVVGVNTSSRAVQWSQRYDDVSFVSALPDAGTIFVARYSSTTVLDAATGTTVWHSTNITMAPNLAEADNAIVLGNTIVYRDPSMGFQRLCAVDGTTGQQLWCDSRRVFGSPDIARDGTFTAVFYDVNASSYVANMNVADGKENWFASAPRVFTGSDRWVAIRSGADLMLLDSMTGITVSSLDVADMAAIATSVFIGNQFFFSDGQMWLAAVDCNSGTVMWNVSAPDANPDRRVELQRDTPGLLVAALLSVEHTNFSRFNALTGDNMWTVQAMPTGMSLAPIHAWLGTDVLYVRNVREAWSAWGAQSGSKIASGSGMLFLPRSVRPSFDRPHFSFYVTTSAGEVIDLRVERNTNATTTA